MWLTGLVVLDMWDLPGPGLEPVSTALAGGFLTTAPPGKPSTTAFRHIVRRPFPKIQKVDEYKVGITVHPKGG